MFISISLRGSLAVLATFLCALIAYEVVVPISIEPVLPEEGKSRAERATNFSVLPSQERQDVSLKFAESPVFNDYKLDEAAAIPVSMPDKDDAAAPTSRKALPLNFRLIGVYSNHDKRYALVLNTDSGEQTSVRPGNTIDGWEVRKIGLRGIEVVNGARVETITFLEDIALVRHRASAKAAATTEVEKKGLRVLAPVAE